MPTMHPVFGRHDLDYDTHFVRWRNWNDPGCVEAYQAMALNIMYDWRVNERRAAMFHDGYMSGALLEDALSRYYRERVRSAKTPDFVDNVNRENIVAGAPDANLIDEDTLL